MKYKNFNEMIDSEFKNSEGQNREQYINRMQDIVKKYKQKQKIEIGFYDNSLFSLIDEPVIVFNTFSELVEYIYWFVPDLFKVYDYELYSTIESKIPFTINYKDEFITK